MKQFKKWVAAAVFTALVFTAVVLPAGEALAYVLPDSNLSYGMSGEAVLSLQQALQEQGYLEATPDGIFGNLTKEALLSFQTDAGIGADAIAGPVTLSALYGISADEIRSYFGASGSNGSTNSSTDSSSNASSNTDNSNPHTARPTLYKGKSGDDVLEQSEEHTSELQSR